MIIQNKRILIPTIFTIFATITLLSLGTWQVNRLIWKNNLIEKINHQTKLEPIELYLASCEERINDAALQGKIGLSGVSAIVKQEAIEQRANPECVEKALYRQIKVSGKFLNDQETHLFTGPKEMRGEPGYNIITPIQRDDGSVVLVDRGWVPFSKKEKSKRPESITGERVSIVGILQKGEKKGLFTPENNIKENLWFWLDIPSIASFTGKKIDNVYVKALKGANFSSGTLPIPADLDIKIRNNHLEYAITWYSLALAMVVIYLIHLTKWKNNNGKL